MLISPLTAVLVEGQDAGGPLAGSWTPDMMWGGYGGRVYSTALSAMCLEVYYRYKPLPPTSAILDWRPLKSHKWRLATGRTRQDAACTIDWAGCGWRAPLGLTGSVHRRPRRQRFAR